MSMALALTCLRWREKPRISKGPDFLKNAANDDMAFSAISSEGLTDAATCSKNTRTASRLGVRPTIGKNTKRQPVPEASINTSSTAKRRFMSGSCEAIRVSNVLEMLSSSSQVSAPSKGRARRCSNVSPAMR